MRRSLAAFLLIGWAAAGARADIVHLSNGRSMEGIVVSVNDTQVRLRLPFGEIGLPRTSVTRVEREVSAFEEYLERRDRLAAGAESAAEWLDLALWARSQELDQSAREAALEAAWLNPGIPGLAPLMREIGYDFDPERHEWIPFDELMRRRGYIRSNGRWLTADEALTAQRARESARRRDQEGARQERLTRAMELLVLAQWAEAEETRRARLEAASRPIGIPVFGYPLAIWPGGWPPPPLRPKPLPTPAAPDHRQAWRDAVVSRPPGSWIPVSPQANRGGIQKAAEAD